jgi:hypothetical protein
VVPLKQRAPEYQRSKAPEKVLFFCIALPQADANRKELKSTIFCGENIGQNQFAFSISQLKPLLAFHLIPIKTACLAAAL